MLAVPNMPVEFRLRPGLDAVLKSLALRAHQKGLELLCQFDPDVPEVVIADPGRLRQILVNLNRVLDAAGATMADVLKVTVFLTNIDDRAAINPVRQEFFGSARPASTLIEVSRLALPDMKVEIEAVVGLPEPK